MKRPRPFDDHDRKPVFLSKAEREKLAIQRREEEAAEKRQLQQRSRPISSTEPSSSSSAPDDNYEQQAEREREKEVEAIKEQYLGLKKPKKRVIKPSEKFHFSFDWENSEDTSRDMNVLYQNPHEARPLFGRGFRAGMDRREQKKLSLRLAFSGELDSIY